MSTIIIHCSQTVAQAINTTMGQGDTMIITFDLAIFVKAKQIQWRFANKFSDVVSSLGTFHIALNFLTVIGKKYLNSGLEDLPIVSGVSGMPLARHPN